MKKLEYLLKHSAVILVLYRIIMSTFFRFVGLFVPINNSLLLMNGHGYKYNDSPRTIYQTMRKYGIDNNYQIVWALKNPEQYEIPGNAEKIKIDTFAYFVVALRAKYWISCVNIERGLHFKKKKTIYLNTWHGASLNYVGNAVAKRNDYHFENINYFCYNGEYEREFIKRDFNVRDHSLIPTGYPRNDALYEATAETKASIRKRLGVPENKRIILYAPTWRDSEDGGKTFALAPPVDWKKWEEKLGKDYILFLRTHPYTTELMSVQFNDFVRNYTDYPEVNDLLIAADILISDYSCIQLDYSILGRPQICFGYDYEEYNSVRGFYFDLETTLPNGVVRTEDQVIDIILNMDYESEREKSIAFRDKHMEYGGHAAEKCISYVFGIDLMDRKINNE